MGMMYLQGCSIIGYLQSLHFDEKTIQYLQEQEEHMMWDFSRSFATYDLQEICMRSKKGRLYSRMNR